MKVFILSMQQVNNYGSVLQAYSLKKMIQSLGGEVEFLAVKPGENEELNLLCANSDIDKKSDSWIKTQLNRIKGRIYGKQLRYVFNEFRNTTGLNSVSGNEKADICVIGSDEVFNCLQKSKWGFSTQLFGNVECAKKVISYAASCGSTKAENLPNELREPMKKAMDNLSAISVRDKNTADFVQKVSGKEIVYNLDPVAVGDFSEEIRNIDLSGKVPKKYCIIYSYSGRFNNQDEIQAITEYCKEHNLEMFAPFGRQSWISSSEILTPFELLKAFQDAECIITDTFHGALFGAKFGKKLAVLIRESNKNKLVDLTNRIQIQDHVVTDVSKLNMVLEKELNKDCITDILISEREKSLSYLKENLKVWEN